MNEFVEKEQYPLSRTRRGIGVIIVNIFEKHDTYKRDGAGYEVDKLSELFTEMGLEVRVHIEKTRNEMVKILKDVSGEARLKTDSMIAVAISSHGCEEGLLGINVEKRIEWTNQAKIYNGEEDTISQDDIKTFFNGKNCSALSEKPKLLLLNGCRGRGKEDLLKSDVVPPTILKEPPKKIATTWSDFFIMYSCQPGMESIRNVKLGSLFIDVLLSTYKTRATDLPLEMLLPIVNRELMNACDSGKVEIQMQCCIWESSCTSFLKIPPISSTSKIVPGVPTTDHMELVWATVTKGTKGTQGPNQMSNPQGLTITPSGEIYITDPAAQCIWAYSTDGEPMYQDVKPKEYKQLVIENLGLKYAWGVCVFKNFLFVSCSLAITKFCLLTGALKTHKIHSFPITGLDIDPSGIIYLCERQSCNVILLDQDLNVKDRIKLAPSLNPAKDRLMDIKVLGQEMYVLVKNSDHTIQIFDVKGTHLKDLVSKDFLRESHFFTINRTNKCIYAGDFKTNELKAFDQNGTLLYKTGQQGDARGDITTPNGIDLTAQGEVVVVCSDKKQFMLQSFQAHYDM